MLTRASIHTPGRGGETETTPQGAPPELTPDDRDPHAVALGRRGASRGGHARTGALTPAERSELARHAAMARWSTPLGPDGRPVKRGAARGARRRCEFTVKGRRVCATRAQVERALRRVTPERIRRHFVEVGGVRYPIRQALAVAFGLSRARLDNAQARGILLRLGFEVGSLGPEATGPPVQAGIRPRFPRASGLPRPERVEVSPEDGEPAAQVQAIEVPPIVLPWSPWHRWGTLREDERRGSGVLIPPCRPGVYEVMAEGQRMRLTIGRTSNLRVRVKQQLVMGASGKHPAREAILRNEDLGRVFVRWAPTDYPATAEEALHREHVRRHGRLPKYTQRT